jgi:hypothetical protein
MPAAHASGVFIPREVITMTTKRTTAFTADGGTTDTHANASSADAARAQAEWIDLLARLVLASVEHSATAKEQEQTATHGKKPHNKRHIGTAGRCLRRAPTASRSDP